MSWLDDPAAAPATPRSAAQGRQWLDTIWYVERSLLTDQLLVTTDSGGNPWLHAWSYRSHVIAASSSPPEEVDCAEMSGRELRRQRRHSSQSALATAGILLHHDRDEDGVVAVWPAALATQPVQAE